MKSLWDDKEASKYKNDLALRVYTSRLLGQDASLVLHGGGNTSVKIKEKNLIGQEEDILYVKGSGWDLATIEEPGFAPVRMQHLIELSRLPSLTDPQMVNELKTQLTLSSAPGPSVEAILHAILPFKFVDHTHSDAVVSVTNTKDGLENIKKIYGDKVVIIPYVMPGFDLARLAAEKFEAESTDKTIGMVLMNHGIFSFAETAKESYQRMISLVDMAEQYLKNNDAWDNSLSGKANDKDIRIELANLRQDVSRSAGRAMIVSSHTTAKTIGYAEHKDVAEFSQQGPATPDHVIRTKRLPMLGRDIDAYTKDYKSYFKKESSRNKAEMKMLDTAPRVILDKEFGLCAVGKTIKDADIVSDIYDHTIDIIMRGEAQGGYKALPANDIFDVEYWDLEQAKLRKGGTPPVFTGEVAYVTGAASGIGKASVDSLLARGAAVVGIDIDPAIEGMYDRADYLGIVCDVTDETSIVASLEKSVRKFGGLDILILNAGMFPKSNNIDNISTQEWRKVMSVNLDSKLTLMRDAHPLLKRAPNGGRVVVIGSKNVPAPGPGAGAYSASKAALTQLMRVAALEWGGEGIRINTVHPNAVFDTAIWTDEVLEHRAKSYGMSVEEYKTNNVLKTIVTSKDVAELVAEMCGPLFAKTTASQVPIDGGNERVI